MKSETSIRKSVQDLSINIAAVSGLIAETQLPSGRKATFGEVVAAWKYVELQQAVERKEQRRQKRVEEKKRQTVKSTFSQEHWQQFDGTGDYVEVSENPSLELTNQLTLEAWINFDAGGTENPRIIFKS